MPSAARETGPTAARLAENVRALRKQKGLSLAQLAERMTALGQPLSLAGLSQIELGNRRVDVDDLMALAIALDATPLRLLLVDPNGLWDTEVPLTPEAVANLDRAWRWAQGDRPLDASGSTAMDTDKVTQFRRENTYQGEKISPLSVKDIQAHAEALQPFSEAAVKVHRDGLTWAQIADFVQYIEVLVPLMARLEDPEFDPILRSGEESGGQPQ